MSAPVRAWIAEARRLRAGGLSWRRVAELVGVSEGRLRYALDPFHRQNCLDGAKRQAARRKAVRMPANWWKP